MNRLRKASIIFALLWLLPQSLSGQDFGWVSNSLQNRNLDELSGLAASQQYDGAFWGINDSGNAPVLYALDEHGRDLGHVRMNEISNRDIEAITYGECEYAPKCIYVADIGDNRAERRQVRIEVFAEPAPNQASINPAKTYFIEYENGPRDAEAVALTKDGDILIFEKVAREITERNANIYKVVIDYKATNGHVIAQKIGELARRTNEGGFTGPFTDASLAQDGDILFIRDYRRIYWAKLSNMPNGVLSLNPIESPPMAQGEAIALDKANNNLIISSEGRFAPIVAIDISAIVKSN